MQKEKFPSSGRNLKEFCKLKGIAESCSNSRRTPCGCSNSKHSPPVPDKKDQGLQLALLHLLLDEPLSKPAM